MNIRTVIKKNSFVGARDSCCGMFQPISNFFKSWKVINKERAKVKKSICVTNSKPISF
jgi:hypothetical protein